MNTENCVNCGCSIHAEEVEHCCHCGGSLCENYLRVPDPDQFPEAEAMDYCLLCYVELGFGELWKVSYWNIYGDVCTIDIDTKVNECSFRIPHYARQDVPLWGCIRSWRKVKVIKPYE